VTARLLEAPDFDWESSAGGRKFDRRSVQAGAREGENRTMARTRLSALDGSFLRVETPAAHMHVGWKGRFSPRADGAPLTLSALRASIAGRLRHAPRFRQRLAFPPAGMAEPVWVDDAAFDVRRHVLALNPSAEPLSRARFDDLADRALSEQLDRGRALWRILFAPRLAEGGSGLVMQAHHAMVDGKSAVELALLLLDSEPDAPMPEPDLDWRPRPAPGSAQLALEAMADTAAESLRMAGGLARLATNPRGGARLADTLRRAALSVGEDLVRSAPASHVNAPIGPRRTLVHQTAPLAPLLEVKTRHQVTLNDVALTVAAGALRKLALHAGQAPRSMKVMVPVSLRTAEQATDLGNQISFVFIDLPIERADPLDRLSAINQASRGFKSSGRPAGGKALLDVLDLMPGLVRDRAARLAASPRMYNLTISNVPGPRVPVYLLGAELAEAVPVIPLAEGHALAIGIFTYLDRVTFGGYADPEALPGIRQLPDALDDALLELTGASEAAGRRELVA
jgi:diacylglycerol O-acyltransferase / wax synthase